MNYTELPFSSAYRGSDDSGARPVTVTGASSLLVVFLVLCFVTLAALTLSTAMADMREAQLSAARTTAYYAACAEAETIAAQLDARLAAAENTGSRPRYEGLNVTEYDDKLAYTVRIDDRSAIAVELKLTPDGPHYFDVVRWQTITDAARAESRLTLITTGEQP